MTCVLAFVAALLAFGAISSPVTSSQAETAVENWIAGKRSLDPEIGRKVISSQKYTTTNGAVFHVVSLDKGFAVTSGDTKLEPVIALSSGNGFSASTNSPLLALLQKDASIRLAALNASTNAKPTRILQASSAATDTRTREELLWAKLLAGSTTNAAKPLMTANASSASVADIRVAPLIESSWGQDSVGNVNVFNRFTPGNGPCGCVATAGAQIMRFFQWPMSSIPQYTSSFCTVNSQPASLTTQGGIYDWSAMPLIPNGTITAAQADQIGKLTSDIGICCAMDYNQGYASAGGYMLSHALTKRFGYSNATAMQKYESCSAEETKNALASNLDAGLPVAVSISGNSGGHEIVGDGYGYSDGTLFYHFNMGWNGLDNAWYAPPDLSTSGYSFNVLEGFVYNIYTNAPEGHVICSGRVLSSSMTPVPDALVTVYFGSQTKSTLTNDKGIYSFILEPGTYIIRAMSGTATSSINVSLQACVSNALCDEDSGYFGQYWTNPTPTVGNRCDQDIILSSIAEVAPPTILPSLAGGLFYPTLTVTMSCETSGATIHYTLDGSDPTESSQTYTGPFAIDDDTTVKAKAFKSGHIPSAIATAVYVYDKSQGKSKGDDFANQLKIQGANGTKRITGISLFTTEDGEPLHTLKDNRYYLQYHSVWFEWTAPGSGSITFSTDCSGAFYYPDAIAAYSGGSLASLKRLAMSLDDESNLVHSSKLELEVEQGATYHIAAIVLYHIEDDSEAELLFKWEGDLETKQPAKPRLLLMYH